MHMPNLPGFTAERGIRAAASHLHSGAEDRVVPQAMRRPVGFGDTFDCTLCVLVCSVIVGDVVACYYACRDVGACTITAVAGRA